MIPHGGELIKIARELRGYSQDELARQYGIGVNTIWRWEKRQTEPSFSDTIAVLSYLKYSLMELCIEAKYDPCEICDHAY